MKVKPGDFVKKIFYCGSNKERMWVKVRSIKGGKIKGTLYNKPVACTSFRYGSVVSMDAGDVIDTMSKEDFAKIEKGD